MYFQCYKQLEIESPDFCYRMKLKNISWGSCTYKANLENGYSWGHFNINKRKDNAKYLSLGMDFFSKSLSSKITTKTTTTTPRLVAANLKLDVGAPKKQQEKKEPAV